MLEQLKLTCCKFMNVPSWISLCYWQISKLGLVSFHLSWSHILGDRTCTCIKLLFVELILNCTLVLGTVLQGKWQKSDYDDSFREPLLLKNGWLVGYFINKKCKVCFVSSTLIFGSAVFQYVIWMFTLLFIY